MSQSSKRPYAVTADALISLDVPEQTNTYKPVSYGRLIDSTRELCSNSGLIITSEEYDSEKRGLFANGRYVVKAGDSEMGLMIAWQNSYDRTLSLKFAIGSHVFICANGMVVGDMGTFKKKHIGDVQEFTQSQISEYIKAAGDNFYKAQKQRDRMKEIEISKNLRAELIGRMFLEEDLITATQLGIIKREIQAPTHDYKADNTLWQLYNHTTFALKEAAPWRWMAQHSEVNSFLSNVIS